MSETQIHATNRTYTYGEDEQGEYGSLLQTTNEREGENPDIEDARLKALAEEFEDLTFPANLEKLL
ncbi:MAG: hypothetical protein WCB68_01835 [Pyrinomonadaceae bacterium]